jgi:hypothetical protein
MLIMALAYEGTSRLAWTYFFPEEVGTRKITLLWTVCGNTALTARHF